MQMKVELAPGVVNCWFPVVLMKYSDITISRATKPNYC